VSARASRSRKSRPLWRLVLNGANEAHAIDHAGLLILGVSPMHTNAGMRFL
jgi:hypothetical protein